MGTVPNLRGGFEHTAAHLVELHRFEEGAEVAFAEAFVAFALDDLEEDRPDEGLSEDLQEEPARGIAVDEDAALLQLLERLAVPGKALVDELVVGVGRVEEVDAL